jgi:hypothetical protein
VRGSANLRTIQSIITLLAERVGSYGKVPHSSLLKNKSESALPPSLRVLENGLKESFNASAEILAVGVGAK